MKLFPLLILTAALLSAKATAVVILDCKVWLNHTGSYFSDRWVAADYLVEDGDQIDWGRWYEISGGEITIALEPGETIIEAWVDLSEGARENPLWPISSFPFNTGSSLTYGSAAQPFASGNTVAPLYFHVETNLGTFSQQYSIIPEPSAACLLGAGCLAVGLRRKRHD